MAMYRRAKPGESIIGRLSHGDDLLDEITAVCRAENIRLGRVEALGAVQRARIGYYDQGEREYRFFTLEKHLEITKLAGNISVKDGEPFVHAHVTLADEEGNAFGGHLASGTTVFACEFVIQAFDGPPLVRDLDEVTGLALWPEAGEE